MIDYPETTGNACDIVNSSQADDVRLARSRVSVMLDSFGATTLRVPLRHRATRIPERMIGARRFASQITPAKDVELITEPIATRLEYRFRRAGVDAYFVGFLKLRDLPESDVVLETVVADWRIAHCDLSVVRPLLNGLASKMVKISFHYQHLLLSCPPGYSPSTYFEQIVRTRLEWCDCEDIPVEYSNDHADDIEKDEENMVISNFLFRDVMDAVDFELHWGCGVHLFSPASN
ncbi:hypothetical protein GAY31_28695 [Azospirillum brasilense]|nr:hypothetical protein [Azospirillum brasilense]